MKFFATIALTLIGTASIGHSVDISHFLSKGGFSTIAKQAACALPCLSRGTSSVSCSEGSLNSCFCSNIDNLIESSRSCVLKCGVSKQVLDLSRKGGQYFCTKKRRSSPLRPDSRLRRQEEQADGDEEDAENKEADNGMDEVQTCEECSESCKIDGCEESDDCDFCEALCAEFCE